MVFYGIGAMVLVGLSWTVYGYVMGKAPRQQIRISWLIMLSMLSAFAVSLTIGLMQGFPQTSVRGLLIAFGTQLICGTANYFQLQLIARAMQKGPNGIIWSIVQSGFIFPFFMGVVCFGVPLTWPRLGGLLCILTALMLLGAGKNSGDSGGKWKLLAFSAFLVTGISQMLNNLPSYVPEAEKVASVWRTAAFSLGMVLTGFLTELPSGKAAFTGLWEHIRRKAVWLMVLTLGIPELVTSYLLLYPGMDILSRAGIGSIACPLMVGSCIIFFELFSVLILREKRKFAQWIALALCLTGTAAICI